MQEVEYMPNQSEHIRHSLEMNLFFLRIMKEHTLFLQLGFTPKNIALATEAEHLRKRFDALLQRSMTLAKGFVSREVMTSGELFTRYTQEAERQTQLYTGVPIDSKLTMEEYNMGGGAMPPASMQGEVEQLNRSAMELTQMLLRYKIKVRDDVFACKIFTANYPLLLDHIIHEAEHYLEHLHIMMTGQMSSAAPVMARHEVFWNDIMHEHAEFIDGLLDPSEQALKQTARNFASQYEMLDQQAQEAESLVQMLPELTARTEETTRNFRNFKANGAEGILSCKVRSVIIPLMADHVLREANHYLRMLREMTPAM